MVLGWRQQYLRYRSYFLDIAAVYKKRKDVRVFLETILTLITISFFAVFALRPTLLTIAELVRNIKAKEETVARLEEKIQNLDRAQVIYSQEEAKIFLLDGAIPVNPSPDSFVRQIEGITSRYPVRILGLSVEEVTLIGESKVKIKTEDFEPLPGPANSIIFSITVSGTYRDLEGFLGILETLRRPVKLDSVSINTSGVEGERALILTISGRAPYLESQ